MQNSSFAMQNSSFLMEYSSPDFSICLSFICCMFIWLDDPPYLNPCPAQSFSKNRKFLVLFWYTVRHFQYIIRHLKSNEFIPFTCELRELGALLGPKRHTLRPGLSRKPSCHANHQFSIIKIFIFCGNLHFPSSKSSFSIERWLHIYIKRTHLLLVSSPQRP